MIPAFIFGLSMLMYLLTIAPTISFFDSGEMIAGAFSLGVAHPPGYPVYVTLGKLFSFIPLGNVAFRVNLMSATMASLTSVLIYYITRSMLSEYGPKDTPAVTKPVSAAELSGIFAALAFSFSYNLWAWAVVSKFYTLNAFVVSCMLMLLVRWRRARIEEGGKGGSHSLAYLYTIAFIIGIAAVVHISQFVLIPVYLLYIAVVDGRVFFDIHSGKGRPFFERLIAIIGSVNLKTLVLMTFFFMLGHSIYLHLPLRAVQDPLIDWGWPTDWTMFKWVYNREGYPTVGGERSLPLFLKQLGSFNLVREFTWAGIPLILAGLVGHFRRDWRHFTVLVFGSAFLTMAIVLGGNPPEENIFLLEQFYIPVYIFLAIVMGGAAHMLLTVRMPRYPLVPVLLFAALFVLYPLYQCNAHYWKNDRSRNFLAFDMGTAELNNEPEFSVLFTWGDSGAFPMWYLQDVEEKRPDVLLIHTPHLPLTWFLESLKRVPPELGDPSSIAGSRYNKLRDFNGIKGVEQMLSIPEDYRDPSFLIKELVRLNPGRSISFDYSSRYSIDMPYAVFPYGIVYRQDGKRYAEDNLRIWRYVVTRALPNPSISLDLDESKAVSIYGYVHSDLSRKLRDMGLGPLAEQEMEQAIAYSPELGRMQ